MSPSEARSNLKFSNSFSSWVCSMKASSSGSLEKMYLASTVLPAPGGPTSNTFAFRDMSTWKYPHSPHELKNAAFKNKSGTAKVGAPPRVHKEQSALNTEGHYCEIFIKFTVLKIPEGIRIRLETSKTIFSKNHQRIS